MVVNSVYLAAITLLEETTGRLHQDYFYLLMFPVHLVLGLVLIVPFILFALGHMRHAVLAGTSQAGNTELADRGRALHEQYRPDNNAIEQAVTRHRSTNPAADPAASAIAIFELAHDRAENTAMTGQGPACRDAQVAPMPEPDTDQARDRIENATLLPVIAGDLKTGD